MTSREKNLLFLLIGALFIVLNFLAFKSFYQEKMSALNKRINSAETSLTRAETILRQRAQWDAAESWLKRSEGKGVAYQTAQANLQSFVAREAKKRGLVIREERIIPWQEGDHYNRVRVRCKVTGMEQQIQQWILALNQNRQLQVITKYDVKPTRGDITKADCEIEVEKYVLPPDETPAPES
ncbi:MAG: GspMb/PilO family protein [Akkermansiaceae bacterium]